MTTNQIHKLMDACKQEEIRHCAYPPCRKPFVPKKSNQICCNPKHTYNMQQTRTRYRRKARHAQQSQTQH